MPILRRSSQSRRPEPPHELPVGRHTRPRWPSYRCDGVRAPVLDAQFSGEPQLGAVESNDALRLKADHDRRLRALDDFLAAPPGPRSIAS